jgi:hypothetical protein
MAIWYVLPNQGGYRDITDLGHREIDKLDLSRVFLTCKGAQMHHPDAVPATGIKRIYSEDVYDGKEIIANGWKVDGLTPSGSVTHVILEG